MLDYRSGHRNNKHGDAGRQQGGRGFGNPVAGLTELKMHKKLNKREK